MRKLIALSVTALALSATAPAYAIHDPNLPAEECAPSNSQAVGHPAADQTGLNPGNSGFGIAKNPTPDEACPRDV
jgi:hypothetical protein